MTGLDTMAVTTMTERMTLAVVDERPWPEMRNGKPHSIVNMLAENCDVKCDQSPSRVPGTSQAALQRAGEGPQAQLVAVLVDPGTVLDDEDQRHAGHEPEGGGHGIRQRPPERVECSRERTGRGQCTELAQQAGELGDDGRATR